MIKRIFSPNELDILPNTGIEAGKLRALLAAYGTKYDFCRFYTSENTIIGGLNNDFIVCDFGKYEESELDELAAFFKFSGFTEIFCSCHLGEPLIKKYGFNGHRIFLMNFDEHNKAVLDSRVDNSPTLREVYDILKTGFDIEFEPWYLDMSHRIRHGVSCFRRLEGSVLSVQHNINGEVLLSQIVSLPEKRGRHITSKLILSVCAEYAPSKIFVLCESGLKGFYQKIGFNKHDEKFIISP